MDPHNIVGREVRAADGGNYGHRVLSYDADTKEYSVQAICWSTGELLDDADVIRTIDAFKISYRYDCIHAR